MKKISVFVAVLMAVSVGFSSVSFAQNYYDYYGQQQHRNGRGNNYYSTQKNFYRENNHYSTKNFYGRGYGGNRHKHNRDDVNSFVGGLAGGIVGGALISLVNQPSREVYAPPPQYQQPQVVICNNPPPQVGRVDSRSSSQACVRMDRIYLTKEVWDSEKGAWVDYQDVEVPCQ